MSKSALRRILDERPELSARVDTKRSTSTFELTAVEPPTQKVSRNKAAENLFEQQCRMFNLPPVVRQWKLLKTVQTPRKDGKNIPNVWRFDFCFPNYGLIVEVDGGIFMPKGGAHSHPVDVKRNLLKRNDAALAGMLIIAFMPETIRRKDHEAIAFTQRVLCARGWNGVAD